MAEHIETESAGFERRDMSLSGLRKLLVGFLAAMLVILLAITGLTYWLMGYVVPPFPYPPNLTPPPNVTLPAEPRFEAVPGTALKTIEVSEGAQLSSYGWVDQAAGIVHIPIERAMELQVSRLPVAPEDAARRFEDAGSGMPSPASSGQTKESVYP